jgi:hypothetical protein
MVVIERATAQGMRKIRKKVKDVRKTMRLPKNYLVHRE